MRRLIVVVACLGALASGHARALPMNVMGALYNQYIPGQTGGPVQIEQGTPLEFINLDPLGAHNVVSFDLDEHGEPLFYAPPINSNEGVAVDGVEELAPGSYGFWCSVHGVDLMSGSLVVAAPIASL